MLTINTLLDSRLLYEEIDGKAIPYKNYYKVLLNQAKIEDIMGSSEAQFIVVSAILKFLYTHINDKKYWIATNEAGIHLKHGTNLSADIAIFDRGRVLPNLESVNYIAHPPKVIIEVDIKADLSDFASPLDYYRIKSKKLLDFGVEQVIWISTSTQMVMFNESLSPQSWNIPFTIIDELQIYIGELVENF